MPAIHLLCAPAESCNNGECWDLGNFVGWGGHGDIPVHCLHTFMQFLLSKEPKNSLKSRKSSHLSTDGTSWSWAISLKSLSCPWKDFTNTICLSCCRYSVMVIEAVLLSFSWLWRSHRRTLKTTTALDCSFHLSQTFWNCSWGVFLACC